MKFFQSGCARIFVPRGNAIPDTLIRSLYNRWQEFALSETSAMLLAEGEDELKTEKDFVHWRSVKTDKQVS